MKAVVEFQEFPTESGHAIGFARLNTPEALNALSLEMIRLLDRRLSVWETDVRIASVVLHGAGEKGFCAGGDVRSLYRAITEQGASATNSTALAFFSEEYRLNHRIHRYPKPIIVWANGIVMGGGVGLLAGASHRVVTESSRIAMPEITIGLFPDVGGSWFLRRLPGELGAFVALTGAPLNASDAKQAQLADHFLTGAQFSKMARCLHSSQWQDSPDDNHQIVSEILKSLARQSTARLPLSKLQRHGAQINALCAAGSLVEVVERIRHLKSDEDWLQRAASSLTAGSPTSAALIWELRYRAESMSLADVFRLELVVALQCCAHPDFAEGVRALLIEKGSVPHWTPDRLEGISPAWLAEHFTEPVWPQGRHPLSDLN